MIHRYVSPEEALIEEQANKISQLEAQRQFYKAEHRRLKRKVGNFIWGYATLSLTLMGVYLALEALGNTYLAVVVGVLAIGCLGVVWLGEEF